jgi:4-hydroxyacetophenone monooxygenase
MTIDKLNNVTDEALKSALMDANIPTLMIVITQLTGDMDLLSGDQLPSRGIDGDRHLSDTRKQEIRNRAFDVITDIRDGNRQIPELPDPGMFNKMASVLVNDLVGAEYIPMLTEDMGFKNTLETHFKWHEDPAPEKLEEFSVTIIGAGVSGLSMAIHLKKAGIPFTILDKNAEVGGTWHEHDYPDCGVDTPNHFYSYSFEPNNNWSAFYSKRDELYAYLKEVARKYDILRHIQFETQMKRADYDEANKHWLLTVEKSDGTTETRISKMLITAVGLLNRPKIPDFPGKDSFEGVSFHSARWQHDQDLNGKRIAIIGTGASAMQFAPAIAKQAKSITILQRSKHWVSFLPDYHRNVTEGKKWLLDHIPFYQNWYRFKLFWFYGDGLWNSLKIDPDWPHQDRSMNAENESHRRTYIAQATKALNGNKDLIDRITPDFPPFAKRMLIDNHWCDMLQQDHVELINAGVTEITENAVIDDKGGNHEVDVIIYATGYKADEILAPMEIRGRSKKPIRDIWGQDPRAYLGITTPDLPNFFMLYGPNTNLAHGGSIIFHAECQSRYITKCLMHLIELGMDEIEVKPQIHDSYNDMVDNVHKKMVWTHPKVGSWYQNAKGRVVANTPLRLIDYWNQTYDCNIDDFKLQRTGGS